MFLSSFGWRAFKEEFFASIIYSPPTTPLFLLLFRIIVSFSLDCCSLCFRSESPTGKSIICSVESSDITVPCYRRLAFLAISCVPGVATDIFWALWIELYAFSKGTCYCYCYLEHRVNSLSETVSRYSSCKSSFREGLMRPSPTSRTWGRLSCQFLCELSLRDGSLLAWLSESSFSASDVSPLFLSLRYFCERNELGTFIYFCFN